MYGVWYTAGRSRGGGVYCPIVVQWYCNSVSNAGGPGEWKDDWVVHKRPEVKEYLVKANPHLLGQVGADIERAHGAPRRYQDPAVVKRVVFLRDIVSKRILRLAFLASSRAGQPLLVVSIHTILSLGIRVNPIPTNSDRPPEHPPPRLPCQLARGPAAPGRWHSHDIVITNIYRYTDR